MKVRNCEILPEVLILDPRVFHDQRGYFLETYQEERYRGLGLGVRFVQDNLSYSKRGVLRGLHYQVGRAQGKLVWVAKGEIFDVVLDLRKSSPTFGNWFGTRLNGEAATQLYIPEGFAHGFCVTSEEAIVCYKYTEYYSPAHERGIRWDDPDLGIHWPASSPILSPKDAGFPFLRQLADPDLFP